MAPPSPAKTGRNDPCPCASGKKYKHCCLNVVAMPSPVDTAWKLQNDAHSSLIGAMLRFAYREFSDDLIVAWRDFNRTPFPKPLKDDSPELQIFNPWFLFNWDPDPPARNKRKRNTSVPEMGVVARAFIERKGGSLFEEEQAIFDQATTQPLSFFEVLRSVPGESIVLRDILIGGDTEVLERSASKMLHAGDVCYGQIYKFSDISTLGRLAPHPFPPTRKIEVVLLRARLRRKIVKQARDLAVRDLLRYAEDIRTVYLDMRDELHLPPRLVNTDGDDILYQTMTFKIGSPQIALDTLAPLAWGMTREELAESADLNPDGSLRGFHFDWAKAGNEKFETWDNTILGTLRIDGNTLVAEVNSRQRATLLRNEIESRMKLFATHLKTVQKTPEQVVADAPRLNAARDERTGATTAIDPELQQLVEAQMQAQVEGWIHQKIPALGNFTPMQVAEHPDGREMVEALLVEWERNIEDQPKGLFRPDVRALRRSLGL